MLIIPLLIVAFSVIVFAKPITRSTTTTPPWLYQRYYPNGTMSNPTVAFTAATGGFLATIPQDGQVHNLADVTCQNFNTMAYIPCAGFAVDGVAVLSGNGPCTFVGSAGAVIDIPFNNPSQHMGIWPVGAPQQITQITCAASQ